MNPIVVAVFAAILLATFARTAVPFAIKHFKEDKKWEWKFLGTALFSILISSIAPALAILAGYEILPGWTWWEAFLIVFMAVSGLNDLLNRYGLTAWKKVLTDVPS